MTENFIQQKKNRKPKFGLNGKKQHPATNYKTKTKFYECCLFRWPKTLFCRNKTENRSLSYAEENNIQQRIQL
jgi:hypothetical protein